MERPLGADLATKIALACGPLYEPHF